MAWFDHFLPKALIGIRFEPDLVAGLKFKEAVFPILGKGWTVKFAGSPYKFGCEDKSEEIHVKENHIHTEAKYSILQKEKPGAFPQLEYPEVVPYSTLVDQRIERLTEIWGGISATKKEPFKTTFVGLVMGVAFESEATPPGIGKCLSHLGKMFPGEELHKASGRFSSFVGSHGDGIKHRCHHEITFSKENEEDVVQIGLDFQLVFKENIDMPSSAIRGYLEQLKRYSFEYFEKFGMEGYL